jgi:hypothetical protein
MIVSGSSKHNFRRVHQTTMLLKHVGSDGRMEIFKNLEPVSSLIDSAFLVVEFSGIGADSEGCMHPELSGVVHRCDPFLSSPVRVQKLSSVPVSGRSCEKI